MEFAIKYDIFKGVNLADDPVRIWHPPEAIKMAPLIRILKDSPDIKTLTAVTAQHREMLDQSALFEITPEYDLDLMRTRQTLTDITCGSLAGLEQILHRVKPDLVLVHGDTTTTSPPPWLLFTRASCWPRRGRAAHI